MVNLNVKIVCIRIRHEQKGLEADVLLKNGELYIIHFSSIGRQVMFQIVGPVVHTSNIVVTPKSDFKSFAWHGNDTLVACTSSGVLMRFRVALGSQASAVVSTLVAFNKISRCKPKDICSLFPHNMFVVFGKKVYICQAERCLRCKVRNTTESLGIQIIGNVFLTLTDTAMAYITFAF